MIKLYWSPRSRSISAIWLLEEAGLPYERVLTDISTGAQKAPEYLAINPMGKVPGLQDGDAALGEAAAICAYIADRYPETKLAPAATDHCFPSGELTDVPTSGLVTSTDSGPAKNDTEILPGNVMVSNSKILLISVSPLSSVKVRRAKR